jgi:hypothetical protein
MASSTIFNSSASMSASMSVSATISADETEVSVEEKKKVFNVYVKDSMNPANKLPNWCCPLLHTDINLPIVIIANDGQDLSTARHKVSKLVRSEFNCHQCAENCWKLLKCYGKTGPILCNYAHNSEQCTTKSQSLYDISKNFYDGIISDPTKFTLGIATDSLLTKDKFKFVNPNHSAGVPEGKTFMHYSGNCDTINYTASKADSPIRLMGYALNKYWILMHNLLVKITSSWDSPGKRHSTKQRVQTIISLCREVTYAEDHFGFTLQWISNILDMFSIPFNRLTMNEKIRIAATAICSGNVKFDDNGATGVVHYQFVQMNGTILMWMESATSRSAMKSMMTKLCKPGVKGRRDPNKKVSVESINHAENILGDFTNTIATTKSLEDYYSGYTGPKCFWQAPEPKSGVKSAFADMRTTSKKLSSKKGFSVPDWDHQKRVDGEWSIPDIICALEAGENIYISQNHENCIIAHTTINPDYLIHTPVSEKGGLMWSFLGNLNGFSAPLKQKYSSCNKFKLVAIHYIKVGAFMNYIFVTDKSNFLPQFITNNPVMLEACLSSRGSRHLGPIVAKLRSTTTISRPPVDVRNVYAMIGIGACKSPDGKLVGGSIPFTICRGQKDLDGTIKYFKNPPVAQTPCHRWTMAGSAKKHCTNCGAPVGTAYQTFCGNCGRKF